MFLRDIAIPLTGIGTPARQHNVRAGPVAASCVGQSPQTARDPAGRALASTRTLSIEQVFPPLRVALAKHPHQVAAGVQAKRPGLARELH